MKVSNLTMFAVAIALLATSCVSSQKYKDMRTARDHFRAQSENLKVVEKENTELQNRLRTTEIQLNQLRASMERQQNEMDRIKEYNESLSARYEAAIKDNTSLLGAYTTEKQAMEDRLSKSQDELWRQERQLQGLEEAVGVQSYSMETMRTDLATREQRVAELERLLAEKESQMAQLRTSIGNALRGYADSDLSVAERNGKIYLSLSQNLLFSSGSDRVDAKGVKALEQLAEALKQNPAIEIVVEGHTDNAGSVEYNWDLSTRRATAVVKILAINGVMPHRMTASGKGMHHPVVPNTTEENKAKNRRTEIVLSPNMDKILDLAK